MDYTTDHQMGFQYDAEKVGRFASQRWQGRTSTNKRFSQAEKENHFCFFRNLVRDAIVYGYTAPTLSRKSLPSRGETPQQL